MATKTFTQLTGESALAGADEFPFWDASAGAARKITWTQLDLPQKSVANTFSARQTIQTAGSGNDTLMAGQLAFAIGGTTYWSIRQSATALSDWVIDCNYSATDYEALRIKRATRNLLIGTTTDDGRLTLGLATARLAFVDATGTGSTKSTPGTVNGWVEIKIGGVTHYVPAYTSKTS